MTPSQQARADAMADAETLRQIMMTKSHIYGKEAAFFATHAWRPSHDDHAYVYAIYAARAAFRAVPGLRG